MFDIDDYFDLNDEYEGYNPFRAQKELIELPELTESQSFLCGQCGSGNSIKPTLYKRVFQQIFNPRTGACIENSVVIYVSPCCKADILVWDDLIEDYVEIDSKNYSSDEPDLLTGQEQSHDSN